MKVLVLGSGVLGVTAAYVLAARGHQVEVLERAAVPGAETSFANGGQLSYTHAEPWASLHILRKLPGWMIRPDSPLIFRPRADPDMARWGLKFLRNCTPGRAATGGVTMLRLGLYSRLKMAQIMAETGVAFDYSARGILHIFGSVKELDHARKIAAFQAKLGGPMAALSPQDVLALEPALAEAQRPIVGGLHATLDAQGNAFIWCRELAALCAQKFGVVFHYNTRISALESNGAQITAAITDKGAFWADAYVLALGSYSPVYTKPLGIHLPIYPMKGYSVSLPWNAHSPEISLTDGSHKIVFSRLGDRLRVAGTAEFAGYDTRVIAGRITPIVEAARGLFPRAAWEAPRTEWACLRPSTPAGPPILGRTPLPNLFLNTGHGTLGWTQAAGSAYLLADIMENRPPEIVTQGLTLEGV